MSVKPISQANFLFPFELSSADDFELQVEMFDNAQFGDSKIWLQRWAKPGFIDDTLLPHIGRYLNPDDTDAATARAWKLNNNLLQSPSFLGSGSNGNSKWFLNCAGKKAIEFQWLSIELYVFRVGTACLVVSTRPVSEEECDWHDFVHFFRFIRGQRETFLSALLRTPTGEIPWFAEIASPSRKRSDGKGNLCEIFSGLLTSGTSGVHNTTNFQTSLSQGRVIPFLSVFLDRDDDDGVCEESLYRFRRFFHSRQTLIAGSNELDTSENKALLEYAHKHWFAFSKEGIAFVGINSPNNQFFSETLPNHLHNQYLLMFVLSLHQRFSLLAISESASRLHLKAADTEGGPIELKSRWMEFASIGFFSQVAQSDNHQKFYSHCQRIHETDLLCKEVRSQIEQVHSANVTNAVSSNVNSIAKTQHALHIVEYLLAAVYSAELFHLADPHHHVSKYMKAVFGMSSDSAHACSILLFAFLGLLFVELVNRKIEGRWVLIGACKSAVFSTARYIKELPAKLALNSK